MKKLFIVLGVIVAIFLILFFIAGYFLGNVPIASKILGTNKPKDLGITISVDEAYSGLKAMKNPTTPAEVAAIAKNPASFTKLTTSLTDDQVSSLFSMADIPNFPFKLTQVKFGQNGDVQCSGVLNTADLQIFLKKMGMTGEGIDQVMSYVKNAKYINFNMDGNCSITNNKIALNIDSLQVGKINVPENVVKDNIGTAGSFVSNALTSKGYNIRKLAISNGKVDLDMDRPLGSVEPWLNFVQYK